MLLYKMVTETVPFTGKDLSQLLKQIMNGMYTVPSYLTIELHNILTKLITMVPKERSTLTEIMPDPWLNAGHEEKLTPFSEPPATTRTPV